MYDRRGVNHNLPSNCGILPSMVFIISTCHENMFWKRENVVWGFYSCSMAIWNSRLLLGKMFNLLDGPTVTEECLMPLEADRRAHGQVERSPLPSPFYGLRLVGKTWKRSVYQIQKISYMLYALSSANGPTMVLVLLLLLLLLLLWLYTVCFMSTTTIIFGSTTTTTTTAAATATATATTTMTTTTATTTTTSTATTATAWAQQHCIIYNIYNSVVVLSWTHRLKFIDCTCLAGQYSSSIHRHQLHSRSIMSFHGEPRWGARARWGNCSFISDADCFAGMMSSIHDIVFLGVNWSSQLGHFRKRSGKE